MLIHALVACHAPDQRHRLRRLLERAGAVVADQPSDEDLWSSLTSESYDLLVADLPSLPAGFETAIAETRELARRPEWIVLTTEEEPNTRAALQANGCFAVLPMTVHDRALGESIETLVARCRRIAVDRAQVAQEIPRSHLSDLTAKSPAMRRLLSLSRKVAPSNTSLLLLGETGVGKEWLARAIHAESGRADRPFVAVNCAAIPDTLLESELFGHERGAFTGAIRSRRGSFELAHEGTLFLDEVADLAPNLQARLLRVLQERSIQRLGSEQQVQVDVRIMAATNQDLRRAIERKTFREDLFYRLSVMVLEIPPLRERLDDIASLTDAYVDRYVRQLNRTDVRGVSEMARRALASYSWPGNVRELINAIERAVLLSDGGALTIADLPESIRESERAPLSLLEAPPQRKQSRSWRGIERPLAEVRSEAVSRVEVAYLERALSASGGRVGDAARIAGVTSRTMYNLMKRHGLSKEKFKVSNRPGERAL